MRITFELQGAFIRLAATEPVMLNFHNATEGRILLLGEEPVFDPEKVSLVRTRAYQEWSLPAGGRVYVHDRRAKP